MRLFRLDDDIRAPQGYNMIDKCTTSYNTIDVCTSVIINLIVDGYLEVVGSIRVISRT
jgi:hypothetical protein